MPSKIVDSYLKQQWKYFISVKIHDQITDNYTSILSELSLKVKINSIMNNFIFELKNNILVINCKYLTAQTRQRYHLTLASNNGLTSRSISQHLVRNSLSQRQFLRV